MVHYSDKRERNARKGRDELSDLGRKSKRKREVKSSIQEKSNLKKYFLRSSVPQYTQKNKRFRLREINSSSY